MCLLSVSGSAVGRYVQFCGQRNRLCKLLPDSEYTANVIKYSVCLVFFLLCEEKKVFPMRGAAIKYFTGDCDF